MQGLSLSDAISLGSIYAPEEGIHSSLIMALKGHGALPANLDDSRWFQAGQWATLAYPEDTLKKFHPWLSETLLCPWCATKVRGGQIVWHLYEQHVRDDAEIDLEDECRWIDEMESNDIARKLALAVYFQDGEERDRIVDTAQKQHISVNAFLAAAARFALKHHLLLRDFTHPDPAEMTEQYDESATTIRKPQPDRR